MDAIDRARLDEVEEVFRTAPSLKDALAAAELAVVRWAWFTDNTCCSLRPYRAQRLGNTPGRALPGEPDVIAWVARVGFDARDRAVLTTSFGHDGRPEVHDVRFYEGDGCRELHFQHGAPVDPGGQLLWVHLFEFEHGLLVREATYQHDNPFSEPSQQLREYFYGTGGRLERCRGRSWGGGYPDQTQLSAGAFESFEYDEKGKLSRITAQGVLPDAKLWVVYRRRTRASSQTRLVSRLVEAIEEVLSRCTVSEQAWCLALHYEPEAPFPPDIVIGVERERQQWGSDVDLLNPAEWRADGPPRRLKLDDPDLLDLCAAAWDALASHDDAPARAAKLLNQVAKKLNQSALSDHLDVTPDFFVYAVDLEIEDLDQNLRAALHKARYRELVNSGLTSP